MGHIFTNKNLNNNDLLQVGKVEILADAAESTSAVRKSQAETIAATAVQSQIVAALANASATTTYSSEFVQAALDAKQDNLSVDSNYFTLVNNTLGFKDLGIVKPYKDTSNTTLAEFIADSTFNGDGTLTIGGEVLDKMTIIFLQSATDPSEKSFVYMGTNAGTSDDFVSFSVDYNQGTIRSFFSGTGVGLTYTAGTGSYSLDFGTDASKLGAQTIPVDSNEFTTVTGSTVLAILKSLESYVALVDTNATGGTATVTTRLDTVVGVTGNNMGTFTQGLLTSNTSVKVLLQELETLAKSSIQDRAAIRSEFAAADTTLQSNIDSEASVRASADTALQTNISAESTARVQADSNLQNSLTNEAIARAAADSALDARVDIIEGDSSTVGSVAKAQSDAQDYADAAVLVEKNRALAAESALDTKIDNLQEGDITFVGKIGAGQILSIRADRVASGDTRDGLNIKDVAVAAGEVFVVDADQTLTFDDASTIVGQVGDKLMATETVTAGNLDSADFNVTQADGSAITVANIGSSTIEINGSDQLDIVADSIGRTQLDSAIEADVDDKRSLTSANTITSDGDTHFVSSTATGAQQNIYLKREQTSSSALTDTARTILGELHVSSDGSANPAAPSYAHTTTMATHYNGDCLDLSMVLAGGNFEANGSATSATQATGVYGLSIKPQLGLNVGGTFVADGGGISNLGVFGFSGTDGSGTDRGVYSAIANMDVATFSATRTADPVPHNDVALIADAKYAPAGSKALYAYGDVILEGGSVTVPSASADTDAVNLGDIKGKQRIFEFDLVDGVDKVITVSGINLDNAILQTTDDNQSVDVSVVRDSVNNEVTVTATGGNLTDVRLLVQELSCAVTQA